ncbi:hypothetical protein Bca4012_063236 [Brassica carinata]
MQSTLQDQETPKMLAFNGGGSRYLVERRRDLRVRRSPGNLHGGGAWLRGLFPCSWGQCASSFTMTELSTRVVSLVGNVCRSLASQRRGRKCFAPVVQALHFLQATIRYTEPTASVKVRLFSPVIMTGFWL